MKNFGYQAERFRSAVYALMLPHPESEAGAIARAIRECSLAFQDLDRDDLDESAKEWAQKIDAFIQEAGASNLQSTRAAEAERLTEEQKAELSSCVYELNLWFHMYFWREIEEP